MPIEHVFFFFNFLVCHLPDSSWKWAIFTKPQYLDAMSCASCTFAQESWAERARLFHAGQQVGTLGPGDRSGIGSSL